MTGAFLTSAALSALISALISGAFLTSAALTTLISALISARMVLRIISWISSFGTTGVVATLPAKRLVILYPSCTPCQFPIVNGCNVIRTCVSRRPTKYAIVAKIITALITKARNTFRNLNLPDLRVVEPSSFGVHFQIAIDASCDEPQDAVALVMVTLPSTLS